MTFPVLVITLLKLGDLIQYIQVFSKLWGPWFFNGKKKLSNKIMLLMKTLLLNLFDLKQ